MRHRTSGQTEGNEGSGSGTEGNEGSGTGTEENEGIVKDATGEPVIGASVVEKGTAIQCNRNV